MPALNKPEVTGQKKLGLKKVETCSIFGETQIVCKQMNAHSKKALLTNKLKEAFLTVGLQTMSSKQTSFYSRPLKNLRHKRFITKENKERLGILLNHLFFNKPPDVSSKPTEK